MEPHDPPRPTSLTISPSTVELTAIGATEDLKAEVRDQNREVMAGASVAWTSGNPSVATVSGSGLVTAAGNGAAMVTATAGSASGTAAVTVAQVVSAVTVTAPADTVVEADTLRFSGEALDANGHAVAGTEFAWASSDTAVAMVDDEGLVTGIGAGKVEIAATASGVTGGTALTVLAPVPVAVEVTPDTVEFMAFGQTARLAAKVRDQIGRVMDDVAVDWVSSDAAVAQVDSAGLVTAAGNGTATITGAAGDISGGAVVRVDQSVDSIALSPGADTIALADTLRLEVEGFDANGHAAEVVDAVWTSSSESVVTVDGAGLVRGVGEGTAAITAAAGAASDTSRITVESPDRAVLVAFYNATDGPNWARSANWLTGAPLGDWQGVTTDSAGRVTTLDLSLWRDPVTGVRISQGLSGRIPAMIGELTELRELVLSDNNLTGSLPPELGKLGHLRSLNLAANGLVRGLPRELGNLSELQHLILSKNKLTSTIPAEFADLTELQGLNLGYNELRGPIPRELGDLTELRALELAGNLLTGPVPRELGSLAELTDLNLAFNRLTELEPGSLSGLRELRSVQLQGNRLSSIPGGAFARLPELRSIYLGSNGIDTLDAAAFRELPRLARLDLRNNRINRLPTSFFASLAALTGVDLRENPGAPFLLPVTIARTDHDDLRTPGPATLRLEMPTGAPARLVFPMTARQGRISADTLVLPGGSTESSEVDVNPESGAEGTFVSFSGDPPALAEYFLGLEIGFTDSLLVLYKDRAPVIADEILDQWLRIAEGVELDFSGYFRDPEGDSLSYRVVSSNPLIANASVSGNVVKLTGRSSGTTAVLAAARDPVGSEVQQEFLVTVPIREGICSRTPKVQDGILEVLGMTDCADVLDRHLATIETLDLSERSIVRLHDDDFSRLSGLEVLRLGHNDFRTLPPGVFSDLGNLRRLFLGGSSRLESLPAGVFSGLSNLEWLIVMNSQMTALPRELFAGLGRLSFLNLKHNRLSTLPHDSFAGLTNLETLWLRGNQLTVVDPRWFEDTPRLDGIILDEQPIAEIPSRAFLGLDGLEYLWLGKTSIRSLGAGAFDGLPILEKLLLFETRLETVRPDAFRGLGNLEDLWLSDSLAEIPPGLFSDLTRLSSLLLGYDRVETIPPGLFSNNRQLQYLSLSEGRLSSLPAGAFQSLGELERLELEGNELDALPPGVFRGLESLERLTLHRNRIRTFGEGVFWDLPKLRILTLSDNGLAELPARSFKRLDGLGEMYMRRNELSHVPPASFSGLPGLDWVTLESNLLETLPEGLYTGIRQGVGVDLSGNPGAPFELTVEARRLDAGLAAPGPARLRLELPEGAPTKLSAALSVSGGTLTSRTLVLEAGARYTEEFRVDAHSSAEGGTAVVLRGWRPRLPVGSGGVRVSWGEPLVLFAPESSNRSPIGVEDLPPIRGLEWGDERTLDVSSYFVDPDGDSLKYTVRSANPGVAAAAVTGSEVTVTGRGQGSVTVWLRAVDPSGLTSEEEGIEVSVGEETFDIDIVFVGGESGYESVFEQAAARWEELIPYGLPDSFVRDGLSCFVRRREVEVVEEVIDDLVIFVAIQGVDGEGGVLASAAPCYVREENFTPLAGVVSFDAADLEWMAEEDWLEDVAVHEIGHVLGIGTLWRHHDLLQNPSLPNNRGADTHFSGPRAIAAFAQAGGARYQGGKVPVENVRGSGSGDSHWRESVLGTELMTPIIAGDSNPLSRITIESLADLGYRVNPAGADAFTLHLEAAADRLLGPTIELADDIMPIPLRVVDRQGRVVRIIGSSR